MTTFVTRTIGDVVSEILMSRSAFGGSFLVLEGDTDIKFWKTRVVARNHCQFVLAGSKPTVIDAVIRANGLKQSGILGIVDDDFDSLLGRVVPSVNVIRTDTRDLETLMLSSIVFNRILNELADGSKVYSLERNEKRDICEAFVARSLIFGQLRWLSAMHNWNVAFDRLSPWKFADVHAWSFDTEAILQDFRKQVHGLSPANLEGYLASLPAANPWCVLHGKDSLNVLAIGLRNAIGNYQHPAERIMQMLRLAYDQLLLGATQLYSNIKAWEKANAPYRIVAV